MITVEEIRAANAKPKSFLLTARLRTERIRETLNGPVAYLRPGEELIELSVQDSKSE